MNRHHMGRGRGMGGRGGLGGEGYRGKFGGRGRGSSGMARSERVLDKAELQALLLSLIKDSTTHGYELIRAIKSLSEGCYAPSPGMVYPALNAMTDAGLLAAKAEEAGRKSFAITEAGKSLLAEQNDAVAAITERLRGLSASQSQVRAPIARALANLDLVVGNIPSDATDDQVDQIITLIDGVARQIERVC